MSSSIHLPSHASRWRLATLAALAVTAYTLLLPSLMEAVSQSGLVGKIALLLAAVVAFSAPAFVIGRVLDELRAQSRTDTLTGVGNRRFLRERLSQEYARMRRTHQAISVLMIDVDELKSINDSYGHDCGDLAIRAVSSAIERSIRACDTVGRMGGDEFLVITPETSGHDARNLADRIAAVLERESPHVGALPSGAVRVSIGIATAESRVTTPGELIEQADRAMYHDKLFGRLGQQVGYSPAENMIPFKPVSPH